MVVREVTSLGQVILVSPAGRWWVYGLRAAHIEQWRIGSDPTSRYLVTSALSALVALASF